MGLEEKDLTQSKDTKLDLVTYEALLNLVRFEWQGTSSDKDKALRELKVYLSEHTNGYEIAAFYLKDMDPWA